MHLLLLFASVAIAATCPNVAPLCGVTQVQSARRFYCGSRGSVSNIKVLQPACSLDSLTQCRDSCLSNSQCVSFGYFYNSTSGGDCTLYSNNIKQENFQSSLKSHTVFYNKHCFASAACLGPSNTAFCSSYLSIPVVTSTSTSTFIPDAVTISTDTTVTTDPVTTETTSTSSEVTITTSTETDQATITTTITTTSFSATDYQCLSSSTNLAAITGPVIPPGGSPSKQKLARRDIEKRAAPNPVPTPSCLKNAPPAAVSSACSCQTITPSTTTTTVTITNQAATTTTVMTTTETPVVTDATTTTTTTTTSTTATVVLDPTTVTYTQVMIQPTPATFRGLFYGAYQNTYNYGSENPGFDATTWNNPNYDTSGLIAKLDSSCSYSCPLPGQTALYNYQQLTLVMEGFFFAPQTDAYTVCVGNNIDNGFYLWSGTVAYSSYNNNNWDGAAERVGSNSATYHGACVTYNLNAGDFFPVTYMFVNGGGAAAFDVTVASSQGTTDTSLYFVPPCSGSPFAI